MLCFTKTHREQKTYTEAYGSSFKSFVLWRWITSKWSSGQDCSWKWRFLKEDFRRILFLSQNMDTANVTSVLYQEISFCDKKDCIFFLKKKTRFIRYILKHKLKRIRSLIESFFMLFFFIKRLFSKDDVYRFIKYSIL